MNEDQMPFECLGYFEEIFDVQRNKLLGVRTVEKPDRPLGAAGMIEIRITQPISLTRGAGHLKTYRASEAKPILAQSTIQMKCGRALNRGQIKAMHAGEVRRLEGKLDFH